MANISGKEKKEEGKEEEEEKEEKEEEEGEEKEEEDTLIKLSAAERIAYFNNPPQNATELIKKFVCNGKNGFPTFFNTERNALCTTSTIRNQYYMMLYLL